MSEDNQVLTMPPLVFVFVCLASMTVLGGTEKQLIKLEQGSLVLFHKVLALQIGNQSCSLVQQAFHLFVELTTLWVQFRLCMYATNHD